ncbi:hypothetical protein P801_04264 [Klebsiella pneumoniae BIDMC 42a]|nr:hypothetical protein [Klebsiella pneumoniae]EWE25193.1 hypothetical protein P801_04264 [Klebsiella pneumoniae BIDMC 42a]
MMLDLGEYQEESVNIIAIMGPHGVYHKDEPIKEPRQPGGCKLKTAPVRPVVAARPAEYVCSEDLFY